MKSKYFKKNISLDCIDEYLYDNPEFFECEFIPLSDEGKLNREVQLSNYVEIPALNVIVNYCYNQNLNQNSNTYDTDFNYPFIVIKDIDNKKILHTDYKCNDIITTVSNYLYDCEDITDIDEFIYSKECKKIICNLIYG